MSEYQVEHDNEIEEHEIKEEIQNKVIAKQQNILQVEIV